MRNISTLIFAVVLTSNLFSQKIDNDTLFSKNIIKSPWAIKIEYGGLLHQELNQDFIDKKVVQNIGLSVYHNNFYFTYDLFYVNFNPKTNMTFDNIIFNSTAELSSFNLNIAIGYNFNFYKNWSSDLKLGINTVQFETKNTNVNNQSYKSDYIAGIDLGIGLEQYLKLKRYNYLTFRLGVDYFTTDYSKVSPDLNKSSINYSLKIGYKGWFRKIIN